MIDHTPCHRFHSVSHSIYCGVDRIWTCIFGASIRRIDQLCYYPFFQSESESDGWSPTIIAFTLFLALFLSGKQDSNLRPPASKAGKQPPLSSQIFTSPFFRVSVEVSSENYSLSLSSLTLLVEVVGFEPTRQLRTWFTVKRANQLLNTSILI